MVIIGNSGNHMASFSFLARRRIYYFHRDLICSSMVSPQLLITPQLQRFMWPAGVARNFNYRASEAEMRIEQVAEKVERAPQKWRFKFLFGQNAEVERGGETIDKCFSDTLDIIILADTFHNFSKNNIGSNYSVNNHQKQYSKSIDRMKVYQTKNRKDYVMIGTCIDLRIKMLATPFAHLSRTLHRKTQRC